MLFSGNITVQRLVLRLTVVDGVSGRDHKRLSLLGISLSSLGSFSPTVYHAEDDNCGGSEMNLLMSNRTNS